jgi:lincosamide nucleotidyltransferase A/C/D/E
VLDAFAGLRIWLDGGWGVDALLGEQTRDHGDLDAAIDREDLEDAVARLGRLGFTHAPEIEPGIPARYVMRDARERQVDLHVLTFDMKGDGWQMLPDGKRGRYPAGDLEARGDIGGRDVACISPVLQLRHHTGYEPADRDRDDMRRLAERFGLALPETLQARP